jgi:hypothetical protein
MCRMNVTGCVPLAGRGLVARRGSLVALTDGTDPGPDPLLAVLAAVADANGDGTDLVLAGTRAALERGGRPAWACAGATRDGEVTVLVHGAAVALVTAAGSPPVEVTASGSMIPVVRTFTGAVVDVRLIIDDRAAEDPRLWLGAGTVPGGGILLTVKQDPSHLPHNDWQLTAPSTMPPPAEQPAEQDDLYTESWFTADDEPAGPTLRMTRTDGAGTASLSEPPIVKPPIVKPPIVDPPIVEPPIVDPAAIELVRLEAVEPVVVDGTMCDRMHFNAPDAEFCRACGASMRDVTRSSARRPRPPLGVLLVDDGRGYILDRDYVIGREPLLDGDVAAGRATPLPISDPQGSVSRLHLRVSLVGWQVEVQDLGSSNGSVLYRGGGQWPLAPLDAAALEPGVRVGVGRRTVQFLPYGAVPR